MAMKRQDHDKVLQEVVYGTGGIPKQEVGAVSVGRTRRRNEQNFFQKLVSPRKRVREASKPKRPGFFEELFSGARFKRRKGKGIDGF